MDTTPSQSAGAMYSSHVPFIVHELLASRRLVQANGMVSRDEKGAFDSGASDAQDIIDTELTRTTRRARLKYVFLESRQPNINSM